MFETFVVSVVSEGPAGNLLVWGIYQNQIIWEEKALGILALVAGGEFLCFFFGGGWVEGLKTHSVWFLFIPKNFAQKRAESKVSNFESNEFNFGKTSMFHWLLVFVFKSPSIRPFFWRGVQGLHAVGKDKLQKDTTQRPGHGGSTWSWSWLQGLRCWLWPWSGSSPYGQLFRCSCNRH